MLCLVIDDDRVAKYVPDQQLKIFDSFEAFNLLIDSFSLRKTIARCLCYNRIVLANYDTFICTTSQAFTCCSICVSAMCVLFSLGAHPIFVTHSFVLDDDVFTGGSN